MTTTFKFKVRWPSALNNGATIIHTCVGVSVQRIPFDPTVLVKLREFFSLVLFQNLQRNYNICSC